MVQRAGQLWERVGPRARDVTFVGLALLWSLAYAVSVSRNDRPERSIYLLIGLAASIALWWRRRFPATVTLAGMAAFLLIQMPVALAAGLFTLAVRRRDRILVGITIVSIVVFAVGSGRGTSAPRASLLLVGVMEAGFCAAAGSYIGARHDLVVSLRERARRAEDERELRAEQARVGERARIAQEMHDVLAHKVSLIALHAGALEVNSAAGPEVIQRSVGLIRTTAREAMEDLRDVLGVLRSGDGLDGHDLTPQPRAADLERVVEASREAGVRIELTMDVPELSDSIARTAYRVVQEGLTNVHKHARGAATSVAITGDSTHGVTVEITNQRPVSSATLLPGSGAGLVGLGERVALVGGSMRSGECSDGGWQLSAWLPWVPA
jgi:signal transduction histidine kinase